MLATIESVKKETKINNFENLSKEKMQELVSKIPQINKDVLIKILEQIPAQIEFSRGITDHLRSMHDSILKENSNSQNDILESYKKIIDILGDKLKDNKLCKEDEQYIIENIKYLLEKMGTKDSENKNFLLDTIKITGGICLSVLLIGCSIFIGKSKQNL